MEQPYKKLGIVMVTLTVLVFFALPLCQSYMLHDGHTMMNMTHISCCDADGTSPSDIATNHISYLRSLYTGITVQDVSVLGITLLVYFLVMLCIYTVSSYRIYYFYTYSKIPDIWLWNPLHVAYARGIIQSKHLD